MIRPVEVRGGPLDGRVYNVDVDGGLATVVQPVDDTPRRYDPEEIVNPDDIHAVTITLPIHREPIPGAHGWRYYIEWPRNPPGPTRRHGC